MRREVIDLASKKGRDAVVSVLTVFGVDNAKNLQPAQYAKAVAALKAAA